MYLSRRTNTLGRIGAIIAAIAAVVCAFGQNSLQNSTASPVTDNNSFTGQMGLEQKNGAVLPADLLFKDELGKEIRFGDLLGKRPTLIVPVFYNCKTGCALIEDAVLKTLTKATKQDKLRVGRDLDVVFFSIHPKETPDLARSKKALILSAYSQPGSESGFHLLTSDLATAKKLGESFGFKYYYDPRLDLIRHPVCTVMATDDGRVCGYTIGTGFQTREVESLVELAGKNQIAQKAEQSMMFGCVMVDPATGARTLNIERIVRISMGAMLLFVVCWVIFLSRKYRTKDYPDLTKGQPKATP